MGVYKQLNNVKYYNKNGQRIDPFCHDDFTAMLYDNAASVTSALLEFTGGEFITPYSNSLACITDYFADIEQDPLTEEPMFLTQEISFELYMGSQDDSVLVDLTEGDYYNPPTWNLAVDFRSDDASATITQKTDSQTNKKYWNIAIPAVTLPSVESSDDTINVSYNNSTRVYDVKADIRSDDASLKVSHKTDASTQKQYFNIETAPAEAQSLKTNGLNAQGFSINYAPASNSNNYCWFVSQNKYVPLIEINAANLGKSSIVFEVMGREDSFGYYAKYYFSSRKFISGTHGAGVSGTENPNSPGDYYPICYSFLGSCEMVATRAEDYFDPSDIVVVEQGHVGSTSKYTIYKKQRKQSTTSYLNAEFFIVNVLMHDTDSYCDIKYYMTTRALSRHISSAVFPISGDKFHYYIDETNNRIYEWDSTSSTYVDITGTNTGKILKSSYIPIEMASNYAEVGVTTFTDYGTGETHNIADYAVPATFTNS